jgi:hypothetical protein
MLRRRECRRRLALKIPIYPDPGPLEAAPHHGREHLVLQQMSRRLAIRKAGRMVHEIVLAPLSLDEGELARKVAADIRSV